MIPRGTLDIGWTELFRASGLLAEPVPPAEHELRARITKAFAGSDPSGVTVAALSVRTIWDAILANVDWPAGSEVLCSAVNIPDMFRLIEHHGFVPVPLDVAADTLTVEPSQVRDRITPRTRGLLLASLFGSRIDPRPLADVARSAKLLVVEDLAQGFAADGFGGSSCAAVSLFSFGLIKTRTALGGAVAKFHDPVLAERVRVSVSRLPHRTAAQARRRASVGLGLKLVGQSPVMTVLARLSDLFGVDLDQRLADSVRGFPDGDWPARLRRGADARLLARLVRRLEESDRAGLDQRSQIVTATQNGLPDRARLGMKACFPVRWVNPVRSRNPDSLRRALWTAGFDATTRGSQLRLLSAPEHAPEWTPIATQEWFQQVLYVPQHPALKGPALQRLLKIVWQHETG